MAKDDLELTLLPPLQNSLGLHMCTSILGFRQRISPVSEATVENEDQNTASGWAAQTLWVWRTHWMLLTGKLVPWFYPCLAGSSVKVLLVKRNSNDMFKERPHMT